MNSFGRGTWVARGCGPESSSRNCAAFGVLDGLEFDLSLVRGSSTPMFCRHGCVVGVGVVGVVGVCGCEPIQATRHARLKQKKKPSQPNPSTFETKEIMKSTQPKKGGNNQSFSSDRGVGKKKKAKRREKEKEKQKKKNKKEKKRKKKQKKKSD